MPARILFVVKTKFLFSSFLSLSFLFSVFNKYLFDDWQFLAFLTAAVFCDTVLGVTLAWKNKEIKIGTGFRKLFIKGIIYASFLIFTHIIANYTVRGEKNVFFYYFTTLGYAALMVAEGASIMRNINLIKPGLMPAWLMKRFTDFNDKGLPVK